MGGDYVLPGQYCSEQGAGGALRVYMRPVTTGRPEMPLPSCLKWFTYSVGTASPFADALVGQLTINGTRSGLLGKIPQTKCGDMGTPIDVPYFERRQSVTEMETRTYADLAFLNEQKKDVLTGSREVKDRTPDGYVAFDTVDVGLDVGVLNVALSADSAGDAGAAAAAALTASLPSRGRMHYTMAMNDNMNML